MKPSLFGLLTLVLHFVPAASAQQKPPASVVVVQHVYEIDGCAVKHTGSIAKSKSVDDSDKPFSIVSIANLLKATEATVLPKSTRIRVGHENWEPLQPGPRGALFKGVRYQGTFESHQQTGDFGGGCLMGEFLSFIERDATGTLQVRSVEDPKQFFEGLWLVSKATEASEKQVLLKPYRAVLNQIVRREKVKDVPLPVGRPTVLSEQTERDLTLTPETMAILALPRAETQNDDDRIVIVITASRTK